LKFKLNIFEKVHRFLPQYTFLSLDNYKITTCLNTALNCIENNFKKCKNVVIKPNYSGTISSLEKSISIKISTQNDHIPNYKFWEAW